MEADQRKKVAEIVAKKIEGKISLVVHVGSTNTKTAVNLAMFIWCCARTLYPLQLPISLTTSYLTLLVSQI